MGEWNKIVETGVSSGTAEINSTSLGKFAFIKNDFYYGDGSLNTVNNGYKGKLLLNKTLCDLDDGITSTDNSCNYPFKWDNSNKLCSTIDLGNIAHTEIASSQHCQGTSTFDAINTEKLIKWELSFQTWQQLTVSNTKLKFGNSFYSIKSAVDNEFIKPLVIIGGPYYYHMGNAFSLYNGGSSSGGLSGPRSVFFFMLNMDSNFQGCSWSINNTTTEEKGYIASKITAWNLQSARFELLQE